MENRPFQYNKLNIYNYNEKQSKNYKAYEN